MQDYYALAIAMRAATVCRGQAGKGDDAHVFETAFPPQARSFLKSTFSASGMGILWLSLSFA